MHEIAGRLFSLFNPYYFLSYVKPAEKAWWLGEDLLCIDCPCNLPFTDFHLKPANLVAQQFWGKINLEAACAICYFTKCGKMQHLMRQFKYRGIQNIGKLLANNAGGQLNENPVFSGADLIIPVPLNKSRLRKRGYNQSANFAEGLAEKLNIPVDKHNLVRIRATETRTHWSRFSKFENMQQVFA
jgi:predicted amidophosphoribosyltransferase